MTANSLVPTELKWLYREIWMWRAAGILIVLLFSTIELLKWRQLVQHNNESIVFETKVAINQERMLGMLQRHWTEIKENSARIATVDEHLRECSACHSHPKIQKLPKALPGK